MIRFDGRVRRAATERFALRLAAGAAVALLAGCGGGGGGGAPPPPPPPANIQAPSFTSASSASVVENSAGAIYQAAATDPEGAPVTFSISGGADGGRFIIGSTGQLNFSTPPNFDLPADSDGNNVYSVELTASDGQRQSSLTLSVTVTNSKEGISVRRISTGFVPFVAIGPAGDSHLLVAGGSGAIYSYNLQSGAYQFLTQVYSDFAGLGVLSIAGANDFAASGRFVVMYHSQFALNIEDFRFLPSAGTSIRDEKRLDLRIDAPNYSSGGWLGFDSEGRLLIATGAPGGSGDPTGSAQNDTSQLGKLIRADPNPNPFAGAFPRYWLFNNVAKGFHQPTGGFVYSGGLLIGDRGESVVDEVNFLANGLSGSNFGWPFKEGFRIVRGTPPADLVDPVTEYVRSSAAPAQQGNVGGAIAGSAVASIAGHYVFADRSGAIFSFPAASLQNARNATERRTGDFVPDVGTIDRPIGVVADSNGRLYILDADREIFRVDAG